MVPPLHPLSSPLTSMARLPRLSLPDMPHHVLHRGNNRQTVFADDEDFQHFSDLLRQLAQTHLVAVHAFVLMPNHFHLLITPQTEQGLPLLMQALGRAYVRYFNARHGRSGTLWEGRYRSTVVEPAEPLLQCIIYIDSNPQRAGLVAEAEDYPWSSCAHHLGAKPMAWLRDPAAFWALGNTPFAREARYAQMLAYGLSQRESGALTAAVQGGWAMGSEDFVQSLQSKTVRRLHKKSAGRPRLAAPSGE